MHPFGDLSAYLDGALSSEARASVQAHLDTCALCRMRLAELRGTARLIAALPNPVPSRSLVPRVSVPFWLAPLRTFSTFASGAAIFLFVALASLTSIRGREVETKRSIPVEAGKNDIAIANFSFSPKMFTVPAGGTVTWINHDKVPHVISSADNQFQKSPPLQPGRSFSNTFATRGTYSYFCSVHPRMTGKTLVK